jgi:hypothetical protein
MLTFERSTPPFRQSSIVCAPSSGSNLQLVTFVPHQTAFVPQTTNVENPLITHKNSRKLSFKSQESSSLLGRKFKNFFTQKSPLNLPGCSSNSCCQQPGRCPGRTATLPFVPRKNDNSNNEKRMVALSPILHGPPFHSSPFHSSAPLS